MTVPESDVTFRILDEKGQPVVPPTKVELPANHPGGEDYATFSHQFIPNRPGVYTVEILATDHVARRSISLRYPFIVLDLNRFLRK
jgi:hypothetical protein